MVPAGQNQPQQHPVVGVVASTGQMAYSSPPYATPSPSSALTSSAIPSQPLPSFASTQQHYAYQQQSHQQAQQFYQSQQHQQQELQAFWANQMQEIEQTTDFKNHSLPLARIKKIMKADEDVRMISAEAPVVFAKACEMFIFELTMRSWIHTEENKRRTLQKSDIGASISRTDVFDFLVDVIPREDLKEEEGLGGVNPMENNNHLPSMADSIPYYYHQMGGSSTGAGGGGMMMGQPVDPSAMYMNNNPLPPTPPASYMPWPPTQQQESHEQSDS